MIHVMGRQIGKRGGGGGLISCTRFVQKKWEVEACK